MHLLQARLVGVGSLGDVIFRFADDEGAARRTVVVIGGGGVGKTGLLSAIASTRPGHAVALRSRRDGDTPFAVADWALGAEDPTRPHALRVASPNAQLGEPEDTALLRRREQAIFDRRAVEGGFALVTYSGGRWLSRTPVLLGGADRVGRHDPRAAASFDDPTRSDLAREAKQALSYPVVSVALARASSRGDGELLAAAESLAQATREAVAPLAELAGFGFVGVDPVSFEPVFERGRGGPLVSFDELPTQARHLVAFPALAIRALHAAWPNAYSRSGEGVALIDDADLHLDAASRRGLLPALREALPNVQWIVTASSAELAASCEASDVFALRRMPDSGEIRLFEGDQAVVH
jgi:hypothetical protein